MHRYLDFVLVLVGVYLLTRHLMSKHATLLGQAPTQGLSVLGLWKGQVFDVHGRISMGQNQRVAGELFR